MTKQKGKFLTFLFSLVPGCGQMYLGFMRRGVSLMLIFSLPIAVAAMFNMAIFSIISIIAWFFSFFDALNLNSMDPALFVTLQDDYLLNNLRMSPFVQRINLPKVVGGALVLVGLTALWNTFAGDLFSWLYNTNPEAYNLLYTVVRAIPRVVLAVFVVVLGIRLISGKRTELLEEDASPAK